jgi:hypothetical protein
MSNDTEAVPTWREEDLMSQKLSDPMTVKDVIAALQSMPQDAIVETEGCDCTGRVGEVALYTYLDGTTVVTLNRTSES